MGIVFEVKRRFRLNHDQSDRIPGKLIAVVTSFLRRRRCG